MLDLDEAKDIATKAFRSVKDTIKPPSTTELAARALQDGRKQVKQGAKAFGKDAKKAFDAADDLLHDFIEDPKGNAKQFADSAKDFGKDFSDEVASATGIKELTRFIRSAGNMVGSVLSTSKVRDNAWKEFKKSANDLKQAIASSLGLNGKKKQGPGR